MGNFIFKFRSKEIQYTSSTNKKKKKKKEKNISKEEIKKWKDDLNLLYSGKLSVVPKLDFDHLNDGKSSTNKNTTTDVPSGGPPGPPPPPPPGRAPGPPPGPPGQSPGSSKFGLKIKEEDNCLKKLHLDTIPAIKVKQSGVCDIINFSKKKKNF